MNRLLTIVLTAIFILYPIIVYVGLTTFSPSALALVLLAMLLLRLSLTLRLTIEKVRRLLPLSVAAIIPVTFSMVFNSERALLLTPVVINATLLFTFSLTLLRGPNMIARFAALSEPVMTSAIIAYCRKVTIIWCLFFLMNGLIATYTVFYASKEYWTLYNGLISYILIGTLLAGEWLVRRKVKQRKDK